MKYIKNNKTIIQNIVLVVVTLIIFIIVFEIILRIFFPQPTLIVIQKSVKTLNIFKESSYLPSELIPGKEVRHIGPENDWDVNVKINSKGLRDREFDYNKPRDRYRVLVMGDSFTFGFGVNLNDTYAKIIEKLLDENSNKRVEVINSGFASGKSIDTAYLFFKEEGYKYNPDIVIYGYLPANDLTGIEVNSRYWDNDKNGFPTLIRNPTTTYIGKEGLQYINTTRVYEEEEVNTFYRIHRFSSKYSHAYTFFKNKIKSTIGVYFRKFYEPKYSTIYDTQYSEQYSKGWELTKVFILELNKIIEDQGAEFIITYIPAKPQYNDKMWNEFLFVSGNDNSELIRTKPQDLLKEFTSKNNVRAIDLYPVMHDNQEEELYFNIDPHWTNKGHELAGITIYEYIKDEFANEIGLETN